jgi:hypothetical protein
MNDNIPYYDGLVGTLQLKRCTIHHLRYTLYHRTNALAAACPKSQSASVDITQSGSRWRGRSQLCSANLYPRPRIPSDTSQQQHFPPRGCHGGRGVQGQRGRHHAVHTSHFFINLSFPPFSLLSSLQLVNVQIPIHSNLLSFDIKQNTPTAYPGTPKKRHVQNTNTHHISFTMFMKSAITALFALAATANQVAGQTQNATAAEVALVEANMQREHRFCREGNGVLRDSES